MRQYIIAGNWKMNKTNREALEFITELKAIMPATKAQVVVCAPFTALSDLVKATEGSNIAIGAENMSSKDSGAFTGEISPLMLKDLGVKYVILGHSERREIFKETDACINAKVKAAITHGLTPLFCIGETLTQREAGHLVSVLKTQINGGLEGLMADDMKKVVIAYEPVWAIGTGVTATTAQADEAHVVVRNIVSAMFNASVAANVQIQYGGSMNAANAEELLGKENVDGGLIGGASLKAADFVKIIAAAK
ncbi:MAG: triose-phosphate isomerase [Fusobacteria bacterium]|nr:triose-phosphate isomerase [Fusobacteriota bacterium]